MVVRGRRSVALQVLSHVVALFCLVFANLHFFVSQIFRLQFHFSLFAVSYSSTVCLFSISHFFLYSLFNEQSMAHASVLSLMWSVQNETAGEWTRRHRHTNTHFTSHVGPHLASGSDNMSANPHNKRAFIHPTKVCIALIIKSELCCPSLFMKVIVTQPHTPPLHVNKLNFINFINCWQYWDK